MNDDGALFKHNPLHEVKEEFCFVEDNHWYGERNLLDLLNFGSDEAIAINMDNFNKEEEAGEEEDNEENTLYMDLIGSKSGTMTIGDKSEYLDNIFKILREPDF